MRLVTIFILSVAITGAPALAHEVLHAEHDHQHGGSCGHQAVKHAGHVDYLHDGHLHMMHADHMDEHVLEVSAANPMGEKPVAGHVAHRSGDDHQMLQHGAHFDCVHDGRLHHAHGDHTDDHGVLPAA